MLNPIYTNLRMIALSGLVLLSVLLSTLLSAPATAQTKDSAESNDQWYQINLLVFQHLKGKTEGEETERWPHQVELAYPKNTTTFNGVSPDQINPLTGIRQNYSVLEGAESGFEHEKRRIRLSAGYKTLYYQQWQQKLGTGVTGDAIAISGGESYAGNRQLEGWVRFSQKRYLHLEVDLWIHDYAKANQQRGIQTSLVPRPVPKQSALFAQLFDFGISDSVDQPTNLGSTESQPTIKKPSLAESNGPFYIRTPKRVITYVMQQKRRMKSKELHYLDHPLMGVIVEVIPMEPELTDKLDKDTAVWLRPIAAQP